MIPLPLLAFFAPIKKALAVARDVANAVPGWIWAVALAALAVHGCSARSDLADLRETHADLVTAVEAQKTQAAALFHAANAKVKALEDSFHQDAKIKDTQDVNSQAKIIDLSGQLRRARIDGRLRDPNAVGKSSASACTEAAPGSAHSDADRAQTAGLLSEQLIELLLADSRAADTINAAYTRCRSDYRDLRQSYQAWRAKLTAPATDP